VTVRETSVDDLAAARRAGDVTVIDVRDRDEYARGHIPGARLIPLPELAGRLAEVPTDHTVLVVCQSGRRSAEGADLLTRHAVDALSVAGGTRRWIASGRPVEPGGPAPRDA
jgi:rhodanese-related sulfurtransferase